MNYVKKKDSRREAKQNNLSIKLSFKESIVQARENLGDLLFNLEDCLKFLEDMHACNVSRKNPYWIAADEVCGLIIEGMESQRRKVSDYKQRYFLLFREHSPKIKREGEDFPGEFKDVKGYGHAREKYLELDGGKILDKWRISNGHSK